MKTSNTFGVQFIVRASKNPERPSIIFVRITANGQRSEISLKRTIPASEWNVDKGMARGRTNEAQKLNTYLE